MPYHFKCCDESFQIFTGIDAKENDLLARWGWEEDILFHVGGMPGGHIYLRTNQVINKKLFKKIRKMNDFESLMEIPTNVIEECLQITKQYSSRGRKEKAVQIHITPWLNVKKLDGDNAGTIQFTDHSLVKTLKASTDKNMVDMLQETRTKRKMKEDDFRRERDAKDGYRCSQCFEWNTPSFGLNHFNTQPFNGLNVINDCRVITAVTSRPFIMRRNLIHFNVLRTNLVYRSLQRLSRVPAL